MTYPPTSTIDDLVASTGYSREAIIEAIDGLETIMRGDTYIEEAGIFEPRNNDAAQLIVFDRIHPDDVREAITVRDLMAVPS